MINTAHTIRYDKAYQDMFGSNNKMDAETLRKLIEATIAPYEFSPVLTREEIVKYREELSKNIEQQQKQLEKYNDLLKFVDGLPFKEGDVAFHKDYGNVIINGICINETVENSTYSVVIKTGNKMHVPIKDLMPISDATKVLYGKT